MPEKLNLKTILFHDIYSKPDHSIGTDLDLDLDK